MGSAKGLYMPLLHYVQMKAEAGDKDAERIWKEYKEKVNIIHPKTSKS